MFTERYAIMVPTDPTPGPPGVALSTLFPEPEVLRIAGAAYLVEPFRLRDVLALERSLSRLAGHPLADVPPPDEDPDPATRRRRLRAARDAAEAWPVIWGSHASRSLVATAAGAAMFLSVALRGNDLGPEDLVELAGRMGPWDWSMLTRVAWGGSLAETLAGLVEGRDPDDDHGDDMDWARLVEDLARERCLGYDQVLDLYLAQVGNMVRHGKPAVGSAASSGSPIGLIRARAGRSLARRSLARSLAWYDEGEELPGPLAEARAIVEGWDAEDAAGQSVKGTDSNADFARSLAAALKGG